MGVGIKGWCELGCRDGVAWDGTDVRSELAPPAQPPTSPSPQASSSSGSGTGLMTSKHPWGPKGVREVGEPLLHLGSCPSTLVIISGNGTRTSYYAKRPGSGTASATAGDGVWGCGPEKVPGGNHFERVLKVAAIRDLWFSGCQAARGLRGSEGHGAPPGCAGSWCR